MPKKHGRPLTEGERALARSVFQGALNLDPIRIIRRKWFPFQPRHVMMAPCGHIHIHPESPNWSDDFAQESVGAKAHFLHELCHVWQTQRSGRYYLPLMRHPFCRYDYNIIPGQRFERYGLEQQAEIVAHMWMLRQGLKLPGKPFLEVYEALVPF